MNGRCISQTELAQRGVELQPLVDALKRDILGRCPWTTTGSKTGSGR